MKCLPYLQWLVETRKNRVYVAVARTAIFPEGPSCLTNAVFKRTALQEGAIAAVLNSSDRQLNGSDQVGTIKPRSISVPHE
jgi:hypothetical protein